MILRKQKSVMFGCFSPPVMIVTFIIEIALIGICTAQKKDKRNCMISIALLASLSLYLNLKTPPAIAPAKQNMHFDPRLTGYMFGFAVILAIVIALEVVPKDSKPK